MIEVPDRFTDAEVDDDFEYVDDVPESIRRAGKLPSDHTTGLWKDRPRWVRVTWWVLLPVTFTLACGFFIAGLLFILTLIGAPVGLFLWLGGCMPFAVQVLWRLGHSNPEL